jgi:PAS domain S-box-containing protein
VPSEPMETILDAGSFLALAETRSALIALVQGDKIVYMNPAGCEMMGRPREEIVGRNFWDFVHPDSQEEVKTRGRARQAGAVLPRRVEDRLVRPDGQDVWMDYTIDVMQVGGKPTTLVNGFDVTENRRMQAQLRQSEERFRAAFHNASIGKCITSLELGLMQVNPAFCRMVGYTETELLAMDRAILAITHPEDRDSGRESVAAMLAGQERSMHLVKRYLHKQGHVVWGVLTTTLVRDPQGEALYFVSEVEDITERKRADEALRRSEERFRRLFRDCPVTMCTVDENNRIRDVNDCWTATFGYTREEVIGQRGLDFVAPEDRARLEGNGPGQWPAWVTTMRDQPVQGLRKDGTLVDLLVTTVPEQDEHGRILGLICVSIDVTVLRENEARYRTLVECAPEAIVVANAETRRFVDANACAEGLFGMTREQLLTRDVLDTSPPMQANGRTSADYAAEVIGRALAGENPVFEWTHIGEGGCEVPCRIHLSRLPAAGRNLVRATITDISGEKRLQEQMRHQEKMAAMGLLAAGVAHEIGNPLLALSMAAQSLERKSNDPYAQRKLGLIREHIDRIARIVRQMNDLARPQRAERSRTDLNRTLERAIEVARFDRRASGVEVRLELGAIPLVVAAEDQLTQVCLNLALNAFDALSGNPPGRERVLTVATQVEGARVRVIFDDTGPGVPAEHQARLFQPFFTTKQSGKGTGLGLPVSHRIVQEHGGTLSFENRAGGGARFTFDIPLTSPS